MQPIASSPEKPPVESQQPTAEEDAKRNGYTALADAPEARQMLRSCVGLLVFQESKVDAALV